MKLADWVRRREVEAEIEAEAYAADEVRETKNAAALAACPSEVSALALVERMRDLSEEHYCVGWMMGLEEALWWEREPGPYGMGEVTAENLAELRMLSELCDGWWKWSEDDHGETFVRLAEWRALVAEMKAGSA